MSEFGSSVAVGQPSSSEAADSTHAGHKSFYKTYLPIDVGGATMQGAVLAALQQRTEFLLLSEAVRGREDGAIGNVCCEVVRARGSRRLAVLLALCAMSCNSTRIARKKEERG